MRANHESNYFIAKPDLTRGEGIIIFNKINQLQQIVNDNESIIVQRYLNNPMIIDEKKFDLRIYLVLTGMFPMKAYLFEEGLVRFCTQNYEEPNAGNMYNNYIHLTNSAINKHSKDYKVDSENCYSEEDTSTNRFLSTVYKKL